MGSRSGSDRAGTLDFCGLWVVGCGLWVVGFLVLHHHDLHGQWSPCYARDDTKPPHLYPPCMYLLGRAVLTLTLDGDPENIHSYYQVPSSTYTHYALRTLATATGVM
ncbi:hypothetical protein FA13DRAFT_1737673, partial [Coprinellus micaceus]